MASAPPGVRESGAEHRCGRLAGGLLAVLLASSSAQAQSDLADCQATLLSAMGRQVRADITCYAEAASVGVEGDPACIAQAAVTFARTFARLEGGTCPTPPNAGVLQAALGAFLSSTMAEVERSSSDGQCTAMKLRATGARTARVLKAYARTKKSLDYSRLGRDLARTAARFVATFTRAEDRGCGRGDAPSIGGLVDAFARTLLCGDGTRDFGEHCDGSDDAVCPGACRTDCTCPVSQTFPCLEQPGNLITLSGTYAEPYRNSSLSSGTKIDAQRAIFLASPDNRYPINLEGSTGVCAVGGNVLGQYGRRLSWQEMHDMNNAGIAFDNVAFTVDGIRIDNVTDGVRPEDGPFTIRQAWLSYVRDDCVENDHLQGGTIEDSLFDGCYVAISERPSEGTSMDGRAALLTVRRSLLRLEPMPGPRGGSPTDLGHGRFFKWSDLGTQLALHDNVFLAEQLGQDGRSSMEVPSQLVSCSNNLMVWLGDGPFPVSLPSCFTVTTDRTVWDSAVALWKQQHPYVGVP